MLNSKNSNESSNDVHNNNIMINFDKATTHEYAKEN
uniref:Uncharacterized protein n=1 Tax=Schistosoma haematobium TaxID=6185 RepID=A0A095C476_SCHHA